MICVHAGVFMFIRVIMGVYISWPCMWCSDNDIGFDSYFPPLFVERSFVDCNWVFQLADP